LYTKQGRIADGLKMDRKLVRLQPDNATAHYNLACSLALSGRQTAALRSLERAVALGYDDHDWMEQDVDLATLKNHPAFQRLLAKLQPQS
jgi:Flp pilus assembly protein TadD